ncbi:MAG: hypothetical protein JW791_03075 [Nanoarchaeota archaeon]|nr:hypothetical protein [Nanoarchaeota archaeon]
MAKKKDGNNNLLKSFFYGVVFPTIILYLLAFTGFINFSTSGWLLPGIVIIIGGLLIIVGAEFIQKFLKK